MFKKIFIPLLIILVSLLFLTSCSSETNTEDSIASVSIPDATLNNCIGFLTAQTRELEAIIKIGGAWTRPHPGPFTWGWIEEDGEYDFSITDDWVQEAGETGVAILPTLWPYQEFDQLSCHEASECEVSENDQFRSDFVIGDTMKSFSIPKYRCAPCDYDAYSNFLKALVERYDGDAIDDMEDLQVPILYWEIGNEPELNEDFLTFFKEDKSAYLTLLKNSYLAIKEVCPNCQVLHGGAAGTYTEMIRYWEELFDLGATEYFDIANIHYIGGPDATTLNVREFKEILDERGIEKEIWVTEADVNSEEEIVSGLVGALESGASKVFFTQFDIPEHGLPLSGEYSAVYEGIAQYCE